MLNGFMTEGIVLHTDRKDRGGLPLRILTACGREAECARRSAEGRAGRVSWRQRGHAVTTGRDSLVVTTGLDDRGPGFRWPNGLSQKLPRHVLREKFQGPAVGEGKSPWGDGEGAGRA